MQNNNGINLNPDLCNLLNNHTEQTIQSPYTRNIWLSFLPPELHSKLHLMQCEADEDMLMRNYLYSANQWLPFVVGSSVDACKQDLAYKLNKMLHSEADVQQWSAAVREALEHMEECYNAGALTKLNKLSKDWRVSVFSKTKALAA